jgi:uncharacterized repeat protein (TIGR03847 family)
MVMAVERFAAGAIGKPGDREFRLEVDTDGRVTAYLIEKLQVQALAEEAQNLLREQGKVGTGLSIDPGTVDPETPIAFRVGGLEMAVAEEADTATIVIHSTEEDDRPAVCELTLDQLDAFAREALLVVAAGRPACPRCGLAMDPDAHNCPRSNGDLRGHRP